MTPSELKTFRLKPRGGKPKGLTQKEAARLFDVCNYQEWQKWEYGTRPIPKEIVVSILLEQAKEALESCTCGAGDKINLKD